MHGYAKRINKDQSTHEGLFEDAYWFSGKLKSKDQITKYDPDKDLIGRKIVDFQYDGHVVNTDKEYVKRHNAKIYYEQLQKKKDEEEAEK